MTAGRPIGERIRSACEILETHGPMGYRAVCDRMTGVEPANAGKYCARAVGLGLMTVKAGPMRKNNYKVYSVVPNWRELADNRRTTKLPAPKPRRAVTRWAGISSIFQMGAA